MPQKTYRIVYTGIFAVILMICSWISIPSVIPFTLQTFGIFLTVFCLGGKQGTYTILIYLLLGCLGIPAFSNFGAGPGYLFGNTGGYMLGFLLIGLVSWIFETLFGKHQAVQIIAILIGTILCYLFGTFWFVHLSSASDRNSPWIAALTICVFPFILPDLFKLSFAYVLSKRIRPFLAIFTH